MRHSDHIEKAVKSYCNNQKSRVKTTSEMDEKVIRDAIAGYKNNHQAVIRPSQWRYIMKSNYSKLAAAAIIVVTLIIGNTFFNIQPDGATVAWADMIETMKAQQWIHGVVDYETKERDGTSQMWVSTNPMVMVMKDEGQEIFHFDYEKKVQQQYSYKENVVMINSMEGMQLGNLDVQSPIEFMDKMIQGMQSEHEEITSRIEIRAGKEVEIITGKGPRKTSTITKDVESGLITFANESETNGDRVTYTFDYPDQGPVDIFALGIPDDAEIIDNRPQGNLKELTDILNLKCKEGLGDFQAIQLTLRTDPNGLLKPGMVLLIQGKDNLKSLLRYNAYDMTGRQTKHPTIYEDIKGSWPNLSIEAVLALDNTPAIIGGAIFNGNKTMNFGPENKVEYRQTHRMDIFYMSPDWLPNLVWRLPLVLRMGSEGENKLFEIPDMDKDHIGLAGLRIRTTAKDTEKTDDRHSKPRPGIKDCWFDPAKDYILVDEIGLHGGQYYREKVIEFAQTDKGQWYPSVIQISRGDGPEDSDMRIMQKNMVIDTSPVFTPDTFSIEAMMQDK